MLQSSFLKHTLVFKRPGGTSRGVLKTKDSWFIKVWEEGNEDVFGIGECSLIYGLSPDPVDRFEEKLSEITADIDNYSSFDLTEFPAISFGLETALLDFYGGGKQILYPSEFTNGKKSIPINGLIWMGTFDFMKEQIIEKIEAGFTCIKLKIGAIDFETELSLLKLIRKEFGRNGLEIRVDANGAFAPKEALEKLKRLSDYTIHSIEQPLRQGQWEEMAKLCELTPVPIALDEELIGLEDSKVELLLNTVKPHYIILKPSLLGGLKRSEFFIRQAESKNVGWWVTSALESNIGLNAIAQWTATLNNSMPQGLGTGKLFNNNISSPLEIREAKLYYYPEREFVFNGIL